MTPVCTMASLPEAAVPDWQPFEGGPTGPAATPPTRLPLLDAIPCAYLRLNWSSLSSKVLTTRTSLSPSVPYASAPSYGRDSAGEVKRQRAYKVVPRRCDSRTSKRTGAKPPSRWWTHNPLYMASTSLRPRRTEPRAPKKVTEGLWEGANSGGESGGYVQQRSRARVVGAQDPGRFEQCAAQERRPIKKARRDNNGWPGATAGLVRLYPRMHIPSHSQCRSRAPHSQTSLPLLCSSLRFPASLFPPPHYLRVLCHQPAHAANIDRVEVLHHHPPHTALLVNAIRAGRLGRRNAQQKRHQQRKKHPTSRLASHGGVRLVQAQEGEEGGTRSESGGAAGTRR